MTRSPTVNRPSAMPWHVMSMAPARADEKMTFWPQLSRLRLCWVCSAALWYSTAGRIGWKKRGAPYCQHEKAQGCTLIHTRASTSTACEEPDPSTTLQAFVVSLHFPGLVAKVLHGFVIQQRVHRPTVALALCAVHLLAETRPPLCIMFLVTHHQQPTSMYMCFYTRFFYYTFLVFSLFVPCFESPMHAHLCHTKRKGGVGHDGGCGERGVGRPACVRQDARDQADLHYGWNDIEHHATEDEVDACGLRSTHDPRPKMTNQIPIHNTKHHKNHVPRVPRSMARLRAPVCLDR